MPRVQFNGPVAQAPNGYATWEPGEVRDVSGGQAAELTGNVYFRLVEDAPDLAPVPASAEPEQAGEGSER